MNTTIQTSSSPVEKPQHEWLQIPAVSLVQHKPDELVEDIDRMERVVAWALRSLRIALRHSFMQIWFPQGSITTDSILAAMGTRAGENFDLHAQGIRYLLASGVDVPEEEFTPPRPFTRHEDGTITLD